MELVGAAMKRLSPWLAVLILCSVPLTAAALDYGPNRALLAAGADTPQLPGAEVRAAARGEMPRPDVVSEDAAADANTSAPAAPHAIRPAVTPSRPGPPIPNPSPSASNKPHTPAAHPAPAPAASWQSLLPGSIQ
jgi:hypothetical protein